MNSDKIPGSSLSLIEKVVGIAIALLTAWAAYQSGKVKDSLSVQGATIEALRLEIARNAEEREEQKLNYEVTMKIFEEVKDIYKTQGQTPDQMLNRLAAALALVQAVPRSDVRQALADAIKAAADNITASLRNPSDAIKQKTEAIRNQADITAFQADELQGLAALTNNDVTPQNTSDTASVRWGNMDVDFFWCESSASSEALQALAEQSAALRDLDPKASGRWRVRKLPSAINRKPGYQVNGFWIKTSSEEENLFAKRLSQALKQRRIPADTLEFSIQRIQKHFGNKSVSVFFCPKGQ